MSNTTTNQLIEAITKAKGQFVNVAWKSQKKPAAAHKGTQLEKITAGVVRAGINFANLATVKEGIANGERGEVQPLPWGEWKSFPYVIEHKGAEYVRLYLSKGNKLQTQYRVNGEIVSKEKFASFLTPSEAKKMEDGKAPDCLSVKAENLINV